MGLRASDQLPENITLSAAYEAIRKWCRSNRGEIPKGGDYEKGAVALLDALPEAPSQLEIRAVLGEVIYGYLEWAYHKSDGRYKMASYAHAALQNAGHSFNLSDEDKTRLKASPLWSYLFINR